MGRLVEFGRLLCEVGGKLVGRLVVFGRLVVLSGGDPVGRLVGFGRLVIFSGGDPVGGLVVWEVNLPTTNLPQTNLPEVSFRRFVYLWEFSVSTMGVLKIYKLISLVFITNLP